VPFTERGMEEERMNRSNQKLLQLLGATLLGFLSSASDCGPTPTPDPVVVLDCTADEACNRNGKTNGVCNLSTNRCVYPQVAMRIEASFADGRVTTLARNQTGGFLLPLAMRGAAYELHLSASGGDGVGYFWKRTCSSCTPDLVSGLRLESSGVIKGAPSFASSELCQPVSVQSGGTIDNETFCLTVAERAANVLEPATPVGATGAVALSNGIVGALYKNLESGQAGMIKFTGGARPPYTLEQTGGALPSGLAFEFYSDTAGAYAKIVGTPSAAGTYYFSVRASDGIYAVHHLVDTQAGTYVERMFSLTVTDCGNAAAVQGACTAGITNECTCGVGDPCKWSFDHKCEQGCWRYHDRFDDTIDCPDCNNTTLVQQACASGTHNECTCAASDPCAWKDNGACDQVCSRYWGTFDDNLDCMDCANPSVVQAACNAGTASACTCGVADPCHWKANGICNQACSRYTNRFDDALDCQDCTNSGAVLDACYRGIRNKCTCAATDPCGWQDNGICETACQTIAPHYDDSADCLDCSNSYQVQNACWSGIKNRCTCGVTDPCGWKNNGLCELACTAFVSRYDDSADCTDCSASAVNAACFSGTHNACTCAPSDPCGWRNDGYCDSQCNAFTSHFDDSGDCLDCSASGTISSYCSAGISNACTCAASDPCNWQGDGYCDSSCNAYPGHFDDSSDCLTCTDTVAVQQACNTFTVNRCTCAASDPCGWQGDGFCDSACNAYAGHFDDSSDCLDCSNTAAVQQYCNSVTYNRCTCASADPCWWQNDGYCDSQCSTFVDHFVDSLDCP